MSIALYGTIYRVIWRRIIVTWNLGYGHWRSFKLVPFQSVTSRRPSEIVLSLVCSGTVQVWWLMNGKSVADHSRHVVRRLQSSVIRTKTLIALPQTLYAAFWWGLNIILIERNNWRGGKWPMLPPPMTGVWRRQTMLNYILHLQSASKGPFIATQLNSTSSWVASAGRYRHKPECKLQTVNVKPKSNNYRSSAECWSVAELNRAEAFGQIFGRCNQSSDLTSLLYVLLATSLVKFSRVLHFTWHLIGQTCHPKHGMPLLSVWPGSWNHWSHQRAAITNFKCWSN